MTKKLNIILLAVVTIVIAIAMIPVLSTSIDDLTVGEDSYNKLENSTFESVEVTAVGSEVMIFKSTMIENDFNDMFLDDNYYMTIEDFTNSSVVLDSVNYDKFSIDLNYNDSAGASKYKKILFSELSNYITFEGYNFNAFNDTEIRKGFILNLNDVYEALNTIYGAGELIDDFDFSKGTPSFTVKYGVTENNHGDLNTYINDVFLYENITLEPQITGSTATLINLLPMIIVAGIVVTSVLIIKKTKD